MTYGKYASCASTLIYRKPYVYALSRSWILFYLNYGLQGMDCCTRVIAITIRFTHLCQSCESYQKNLFYLYNFLFSTPSLADSIRFVARRKCRVSIDFTFKLRLNYGGMALDILIIRMLILLIFLLRINTTFKVLINMISIVANTGHEFCSRG